MRWVFLRPHRSSSYYDPEVQEPLGLEYLAASRNARGDATLVLDAAMNQGDEAALARRARSFQPDAVGVSLTTGCEVESAIAIHDKFNSGTEPSVTTRWIAGGNFVSSEVHHALTRLPESFLLVRFEGECALDGVAHRLSVGTPSGQSATIEPEVSRRVIAGTGVEDLDGLPFPTRPFADTILGGGGALNLQGSRGCRGNCRYCSSPGMSADGRNRWRGRSPEHVVEEIATLRRCHGARSFNFVDEDFLGPPRLARDRALRFAREVSARNLRISFGIQVRPSALSEETIDILAGVGLAYVFMGVESDNPEDFRRWKRHWTPTPWRFVERVRRHGAEVNVGALLFHPHSTFEGIRQFASTLHSHRLLDYRSATNRMDAMPGSACYRELAENGRDSEEPMGPISLPFLDRGVETLHEDLLLALAPLGPPSMHALCALPPLIARARLDPRPASLRLRLMEIIHRFDDAVARTLFALLEIHRSNTRDEEVVSRMRVANLAIAIQGTKDLVSLGLAPSLEELRTAIRKDSGM